MNKQNLGQSVRDAHDEIIRLKNLNAELEKMLLDAERNIDALTAFNGTLTTLNRDLQDALEKLLFGIYRKQVGYMFDDERRQAEAAIQGASHYNKWISEGAKGSFKTFAGWQRYGEYLLRGRAAYEAGKNIQGDTKRKR